MLTTIFTIAPSCRLVLSIYTRCIIFINSCCMNRNVYLGTLLVQTSHNFIRPINSPIYLQSGSDPVDFAFVIVYQRGRRIFNNCQRDSTFHVRIHSSAPSLQSTFLVTSLLSMWMTPIMTPHASSLDGVIVVQINFHTSPYRAYCLHVHHIFDIFSQISCTRLSDQLDLVYFFKAE